MTLPLSTFLRQWLWPPPAPSCSGASSMLTTSSTNSLFWTCVAIALFHSLFARVLRAVLLRARVPLHRCTATIRHAWYFSFHAGATLALSLYYMLVLGSALGRGEGGRSIFTTVSSSGPLSTATVPAMPTPMSLTPPEACAAAGSGGCAAASSTFGTAGTMLTAFHVVAAVLALNGQDYAEGVSEAGLAVVLHGLQANGLEHFTVLLNIWLGLHQLTVAAVHTLALHAGAGRRQLLRLLLAVRLIGWAYVYLHLLPFDFLVPALYASGQPWPLWLNAALWLWYGCGVWQSPVLQFCYHQLYGLHDDGAAWDGAIDADAPKPGKVARQLAIARRVLVPSTPEMRHYRALAAAYADIQYARQKADRSERPSTEVAAARTFQTLKCMMTMRRKLKRIRENNASNMHSLKTYAVLP